MTRTDTAETFVCVLILQLIVTLRGDIEIRTEKSFDNRSDRPTDKYVVSDVVKSSNHSLSSMSAKEKQMSVCACTFVYRASTVHSLFLL